MAQEVNRAAEAMANSYLDAAALDAKPNSRAIDLIEAALIACCKDRVESMSAATQDQWIETGKDIDAN